MLSFNDAEEQIVNKILDSLATMDFQQINFSAESVLSFSNITIYPQECRIEINGELNFKQTAICFTVSACP